MNDVTLVIPWGGKDEPLLYQALRSFPNGTECLIGRNDDKLGMAAVMTAMLDQVSTPWVFRMDADDLATPGMLEALREGCGSADGAYPSLQSFGAMTHVNMAEPFSPARLHDDNMVPGPLLIRTEALRAVGGWRAHPMEDWDLAYRLGAAGYLLTPVRTARYLYRRRAGTTNNLVGACLRDGDFTMDEVRQTISGDRKQWPAVFYSSQSSGVAYARGVCMAHSLPAPVRETYRADAHDSDVGVWHHPNGPDQIEMLDDERKLGRAVVVDVDDNYLSPRLVSDLEKSTRWEPELADTARRWARNQATHRRIAAEADMVVCSTEALANEYRTVNENVRVIRNVVVPEHWRRRRKPGKRIRVGWAAAAQHGPDARVATPALRWCAAQKDVEVVCIGLDPGFDFPYTHVPQTRSVHAYRDVLATLDVGIAPLRQGGVNPWKSDLKWLEYTAAGAATVATKLEPYASITHDSTGLLAKDRDDFAHQVMRVVEDSALRRRLAKQARREVLATRTSVQAAEQYRAALATLDREAVAA